MKIKKTKRINLVRRFEKSTFFIIFICNLKWFEFERDLFFEVSKIDQISLLACFNWNLKSYYEISSNDMCWNRSKLIFMSLNLYR